MEVEEYLKALDNCLKCGCASLCDACNKCTHCPSCPESSEKRSAWANKTVRECDFAWSELQRVHKLEATKMMATWMLCMLGWNSALDIMGVHRFVLRLLITVISLAAWHLLDRKLKHAEKHRAALKTYGERVRKNGWATTLPIRTTS